MVKKLLIVLPLLLFLSSQAIAADKGIIELKAVSEVDIIVKNEKGEDEVMRVEAAKANVGPADTVIFTTYYTNNGEEPASDIVINNPVPEHTSYIDGSASGKGTEITFSIDGGKTHDKPENLIKRLDDGTEVKAEPSEYTDIRWAIKGDLQPGDKGDVSFKAEVK